MNPPPDSRNPLPNKGVTNTDDSLAFFKRNDPDLVAVVTAWPKLPEAVKAGIVTMVKAAKDDRFSDHVG